MPAHGPTPLGEDLQTSCHPWPATMSSARILGSPTLRPFTAAASEEQSRPSRSKKATEPKVATTWPSTWRWWPNAASRYQAATPPGFFSSRIFRECASYTGFTMPWMRRTSCWKPGLARVSTTSQSVLRHLLRK
eukprot:1808160-Alexandrium_andersonii.AAC.1